MAPALAPLHAFLLLQGVETLHLRMERHAKTPARVAEYLERAPARGVGQLAGAGVESATTPWRSKYLPQGRRAPVLTFGISGGAAAGEKFIEALQFLSHLANIGDAKSLVIHPASTTHRQLCEEDQLKAGVPPDMVRLSVGIEIDRRHPVGSGSGARPQPLTFVNGVDPASTA